MLLGSFALVDAEAASAKTLRYSGTTSEGKEVHLKVERSGRGKLVITDAMAGFGAWQCGGTGAPAGVANFNLAVNDVKVQGRFFKAVAPGFVDGTVVTTTGTFKSTLKKVSGTITHSGTPLDPTNSPCIYSSQSVRWSAKR